MLFWGNTTTIKKKGKAYRKTKNKTSNNYNTHLSPIKHNNLPKRAVLSASMTVEAALVMPLFLFFCIVFIHIINLVSFQTRLNEAMYNTVRSLAKAEYAVAQSANHATALAMTWMELGNDKAKAAGVTGGNAGLLAISSDFSEDNVDFVLKYASKTPFDFLKIRSMNCVQRAYVRKWIGNEDKKDGDPLHMTESEQLVYITDYGTVYHLDRNCTHLRLSIQAVSKSSIASLRNAEGAKFYACERCGQGTQTVYITDFGNRYHGDINCSGLKRLIIVVPKKAVEGWPACSRCKG